MRVSTRSGRLGIGVMSQTRTLTGSNRQVNITRGAGYGATPRTYVYSQVFVSIDLLVLAIDLQHVRGKLTLLSVSNWLTETYGVRESRGEILV